MEFSNHEDGPGCCFRFTVKCHGRDLLSDDIVHVYEEKSLVEDVPVAVDKKVPENLVASLRPVLVVDDNMINRIVLVKIVKRIGFTDEDIDTADDGQMSLEMCSKREYGLILMDISMPIMDGTEASAKLRADQGYKGKILAVTANVTVTHASVRRFGMDGLLTKPVSKADLVDTLQKI